MVFPSMDQARRNPGVTESNSQITSNIPQQSYGIERNVVLGNRCPHRLLTIVRDSGVMKYYNAREKKKIQPNQFALHPDPVRPPWAPVLAIRVIASCWVVHVTEVPGLLTRGRAAQIKGELH